ncbi:hypothetical protein CF328_g6711 [Tilletia controversa]|nr:hypothetical protein CF328_g6711 [Tilletia controversa]
MMVIPPHSSTARWVPTANPAAFIINNNNGSSFGSSDGGLGKSMATAKRKRDDDADAGSEGMFHAARRLRTEEHTRPSIHPVLQSSFHPHSSAPSLPTPTMEYSNPVPTMTMTMMDSSPAGVAWLGHPLPDTASSYSNNNNNNNSRAPTMLNTPPLTPPHSSAPGSGMDADSMMDMNLDVAGSSHAMQMQMDETSSSAGQGWNGVDFPQGMFTLQLSRNAAGHAHPYALDDSY